MALRLRMPVCTTVILIFTVVAASLFVAKRVAVLQEAACFDRLHAEINELSDFIERRCRGDREQLEIIAKLIASYNDLTDEHLWERLDTYTDVGMISRLELLLPGDVLLSGNGRKLDVSGRLSFAKEASRGAHVSGRERDIAKDNAYIIRHYVPVVRDGELLAMLCGVLELGALPGSLEVRPYGGKAAMYVVDGATGDFLMDTWHDHLSNISELGTRKMASNYDFEQLKREIIAGEKGYVVFVSKTTGRYLYFYYEPLAINSWRVALSVPEDVVFESTNAIRDAINLFLVFEAICFIAYFIWMLRYTHSETRKKQRQLDQVNYVNEVERLLFNAHERRRDLNAALERIAGMMSARVSGFWTTESFSDARLFLWERPGSDHAFSGDVFNQSGGENLLKYFKLTGKPFFGETKEELATVLGESGAPMRNLLAVPVKNDTCDVGVLFAADCLDTRFAFLQSVSFSFGMFAQNLRLYTMLEKQGQRDMLLDLYNRNRYETDLLKYPSRYTKSLACIYIDANGLHEINNSLGHEAGDCMLKAIADRMREYFDSEYIYRIGGDEFVAFAVDVEEAEVLRRCRDISRELEEMGYHISTGVEWSSDVGVDSMVAFIKAAEQRMYAAKKAYYEKNDRRNASR